MSPHEQTVAEDYFAAMQRVEQRLDISPAPKEEPQPQNEVVNVQPEQVFFWLERLTLLELCQQERLEIAENLKQTLFLSISCQLSPPVKVPRGGMAVAA